MKEEIEVERHLIKALTELELIRADYAYKGNRRKRDIINRAMKLILKEYPELVDKWAEEQVKWVL